MSASRAFWAPKGRRRTRFARTSGGEIRAGIVVFFYAGIKFLARDGCVARASCSPNASQQSIWGSQGEAEEAVCTNIWGVDPSRKCRFSLCRDQIPDSRGVSSKSIMFTKCKPAKHLGLPRLRRGVGLREHPGPGSVSLRWRTHQDG